MSESVRPSVRQSVSQSLATSGKWRDTVTASYRKLRHSELLERNAESRIKNREKQESSTLTQDGSKTYSNSTVVKTRFRTLRERMCDAVMRTTRHHGLLLL
jgi:hypothetical protein